MENINKNQQEEEYSTAKKAFEDITLENPFNKIKIIRSKFGPELDKPVEFASSETNLLSFLDDVTKSRNEHTHIPYIEDFSRIVLWHSYLILPNNSIKNKEFWDRLHVESGKSFKEMLDKMEELLKEIENESKKY